MSKEELNSYRLTSSEEPTDEMLSQIMQEAAELYTAESKAVQQQLYDNIRVQTTVQRQRWGV